MNVPKTHPIGAGRLGPRNQLASIVNPLQNHSRSCSEWWRWIELLSNNLVITLREVWTIKSMENSQHARTDVFQGLPSASVASVRSSLWKLDRPSCMAVSLGEAYLEDASTSGKFLVDWPLGLLESLQTCPNTDAPALNMNRLTCSRKAHPTCRVVIPTSPIL